MTLAVATDLEGTLSRGETWRGLGAYLEQHGHKPAYQGFFRQRLPEALLARLGLVNRRAFADRWMRDILGLCAQWSEVSFAEAAAWVVEHELWPKRNEALLAELAGRGAHVRVIIASGTYEPVLAALAKRLAGAGLRVETIGTPIEVAGGALTGRLAGGINVGARKAERLQAILGASNLDTAYGDTIDDAPMLEMAQKAVAVSPKGPLIALAKAKNWRVLP
jgi:phosphoserine phosphatase